MSETLRLVLRDVEARKRILEDRECLYWLLQSRANVVLKVI